MYCNVKTIRRLNGESIIKGELDDNRPVIIYGGENDQNEGHQFIIDGYNTSDYYHVNWGWSGLANGYYLLSVLEPEEQGTGGNSGGGFSLDQNAIISMMKPVEGSTYQDVLVFFYGENEGTVFNGLSATTDDFEQNQLFGLQYGYVGNMSIRNFTGNLVAALVDKGWKYQRIYFQRRTCHYRDRTRSGAGDTL